MNKINDKQCFNHKINGNIAFLPFGYLSPNSFL